MKVKKKIYIKKNENLTLNIPLIKNVIKKKKPKKKTKSLLFRYYPRIKKVNSNINLNQKKKPNIKSVFYDGNEPLKNKSNFNESIKVNTDLYETLKLLDNKKNTLNKKIYNNQNKQLIPHIIFRYSKLVKYFTRKLFLFLRYKGLVKIINLMFTVFAFKSPTLLSTYILNNFKYNSKIKQFYFVRLLTAAIQHFFNLFEGTIKGIILQVKGRFNGSLRKKNRQFIFGQTPKQSFKQNIKYDFGSVIHKDGAFGIHVFLFLYKSEKN